MKWNEQLRQERQSRRWTQTMLADKVGTAKNTIIRWENGHTFPHPYYRNKLTDLFGITFEDIVDIDNSTPEHAPLPSNAEPVLHQRNGSQPLLTLAAQSQPGTSLVQNRQASEQQGPWAADHRFPSNIDLQMKRLSLLRPFHRFSQRPVLIGSILLLTVLLISALLSQAFIGRISHTSSPVVGYGPPTYSLHIQNTDPSLNAPVSHLQKAFQAVYPQLVNRFALDPASATEGWVTLALVPNLSSPAMISGTTITISAPWIREHPTDVGLLTHELTLLIQAYPSGVPVWFADGMADYARSVYGPANDDGWSLPNGVQPQDSYQQGGGVAARFLLWLEQHTVLNIIDQLNHALQTKRSFSSAFQRLTHESVDDLWNQYKNQPDIALSPQQLYKTVTSRKPLYSQSFWYVLASKWHTTQSVFVPGLSMSNFAMQADMAITSGNEGGIIFRSESATSNCLFLRRDGSYELDNQTHELVSSFSPAINRGWHHINRVTIVVQKHTIYVYINGQFLIKADDSSSSYGRVGMIALDWGTTTDLRFSKIQVF